MRMSCDSTYLIDHETKTGKLKLEQATYAAKLAEQERIKAEEEKKTREAQTQSSPPNPHDARRAKQLAQREHLRQLLEKSEQMARLRKSIRELDGADQAAASPFRRAASVLAHQLPHIPTGSLLRKKVLKAVDALRTGDSVTTVQEILGEDFAAIRQTLKDCGIRVD
jgi:cystathionine beta-lyase/cystathionine gamma-synthase